MVVLCSVIIGFHQVDSAWSVPDDAEVLEGEMMTASEAELARRAMRLGELAAIRSEEYAAAHPAEISRRRLFFRRLLGERRWSGRLDEARVQA